MALSTSYTPSSRWGRRWTVSASASLPDLVHVAGSCLLATPDELKRFKVCPHALEAAMRKYPQLELEEATKHQFSGGMYVRSLTCKAGEMFVGREHRRAHLFLLLSGEGVFFSPGGSVRLKAPQIFLSKAGDKKAGIAAVDSVIVNISNISELGDCTDLEVIEKYLFVDDPNCMYTTGNRRK